MFDKINLKINFIHVNILFGVYYLKHNLGSLQFIKTYNLVILFISLLFIIEFPKHFFFAITLCNSKNGQRPFSKI